MIDKELERFDLVPGLRREQLLAPRLPEGQLPICRDIGSYRNAPIKR